MITFEQVSLIDSVTGIIKLLFNCFLGWLVIERILLFIKCVKMKWQWKKYYKEQSQNRRQ